MTPNEAANILNTVGFQVKQMSGTPLLILGSQGYDPPDGPNGIGAFTGQAFFVYVRGSEFEVSWTTGPQQSTSKNVSTLKEAIQLIIANVPALSGVLTFCEQHFWRLCPPLAPIGGSKRTLDLSTE